MKYCLLFLPLLLFSCSGEDVKKDGTDSVKTLVIDSTSDWRSLAESWTASLNMKNASIMRSFYADSVSYYGDHISGADVVVRQSAYFAQHDDYKQKITEFIGEEHLPDGTWRVRITKQVTADGKTADYPASLIFSQKGGIWKIVNESDDISDLNKGRVTELHFAPETSVIEGLLEETTGFGKTPDGDPKSDAKEKYYIVWPTSPLTVYANPGARDGVNVKNVDKIQVTGNETAITSLLNRKVKVTGKIIMGTGQHHFTRVVIESSSIEELK